MSLETRLGSEKSQHMSQESTSGSEQEKWTPRIHTGRQALTMAIFGSMVDQMSASTAVPMVRKDGQREERLNMDFRSKDLMR